MLCVNVSIPNLITLDTLYYLSYLIDLLIILQDKSVTQSLPTYFQNSEPHIICCKYNKPIRNTIFKFNKLVSDLDICDILLSLKIVKIQNMFINQPDI